MCIRDSITRGQARYTTSGIINTFTTTTTIVRRPPPPIVQLDPLAQSFTVDETGMFLSSIDLYFASKDNNIPITVQIRDVELGTPTNQVVQTYAEITLDPTSLDADGTSVIKISDDASLPTRFTFPSPVYLEAAREYALVILAPATIQYKVWIAEMGAETIETQTLGVDEGSKNIVSRQYLGGSLFKSQNGSVWTASQYEDLKFKLYKASFIQNEGTAFFYNSKMDTRSGNIERLLPNAIKTLPRKLKVGIVTTSDTDGNITNGVKVSDSTSTTAIHGYIENVGGPTSTLAVTKAGKGFKASQTYSNVPLYNITGNGSGLTATIQTNSSGQVSSAAITSNTGLSLIHISEPTRRRGIGVGGVGV